MKSERFGFPTVNYGVDDAITGGGAPPAAFAWSAEMPGEHAELLKSKGFYDKPGEGAHALAKSYFELNKAQSAGNMVPLPAADAKPEAWDAFYGKLRPESPDKYELKAGDAGSDENVVGFAKKLAHFWGVPVARAQAGFDMWEGFAKEQNANFMTQAKLDNEKGVADLETAMGKERYTEAVANSQKLFKALASQRGPGGQPLISPATMSAIERNMGSLALMEIMSAIGSRMGGEGLVLTGAGGATPTDPTQMTQEQATAEIAKLNADKEFQEAYWQARHKDHGTAVARMQALFAAQNRQKVA